MLLIQEFLQELKRNKAKITGSYADNTYTDESDYDFYVPEKNWKAVVDLVRKVDPQFESCICGHVGTRVFGVLIECSMLFEHRPNRLKTANIAGIEFQTW